MRVLVVEDEVRLAENIAGALRDGPSYAVDVVHDGEDAVNLCQAGSYDLIVLDLMIPKLSGEQVVRQLRTARYATPILVLTAVSETGKTIDLLNLGADDYMTKPFDLGELIARARALIRRGKGVSEPLLQFGDLRVHTGEQTVECGATRVELSPTEYRILEYLMFRPRTIVSKRELLEHLYDFTWEHHSNVIEAHISNLRKKLRMTTDEELLETLRGRGYRLASS
jgi:two-component system response regulator PhoP